MSRCTLIKGVRSKLNCSYSEMVSKQASQPYMWCTKHLFDGLNLATTCKLVFSFLTQEAYMLQWTLIKGIAQN